MQRARRALSSLRRKQKEKEAGVGRRLFCWVRDNKWKHAWLPHTKARQWLNV